MKQTIISAKITAKEQIKPVSAYAPFPVHVITFEFDGSRAVDLRVSEKIYESLSIGSTGELAYSGKRFRKFTLDFKKIKPEDKNL